MPDRARAETLDRTEALAWGEQPARLFPGRPASTPGGAWTGRRFIDGLRDDRSVWLDGRRIDVTTDPATAGIVNTLAGLYDRQHQPDLREAMTFVEPETGLRLSRSHQLPLTRADLAARLVNSRLWAEASLGQMPRLPDFMANVLIGLYDFRRDLGRIDSRFERNVEHYVRFCREHDLAITHALGDPQIDRSASPRDDADLALRIVARTPRGLVVRGAKQLATLAPVAHELLVYLSPSFALRDQPDHVVWFALPMATEGLSILCREPLARPSGSHLHPLADRFDEQDAMVFFDDVEVPWARVFLTDDAQTAYDGFFRLNAWALPVGQIRLHQRLLLILTVARRCAEAIGVAGFREVQNRLGELAGLVEMSRLMIVAIEAEARPTASGLWAPGSTLGADVWAGEAGARATAILREIAASGLVMQPSAADLATPVLKPLIERYMRGRGVEAGAKARLFRLAWDLAGDSYGMRAEIYESWNRGDTVRNRIRLHDTLDTAAMQARVDGLLAEM